MRHLSLVLLFVVATLRADDEPVYSGPQAGEKMTEFKVHRVFGPSAGKEVEMLAELKKGPTVVVFVHELTRTSRQLLVPIDKYGKKMSEAGLATHFVWLSADKGKTEDYLKTAERSIGLGSPISISLDGIEGPGNYGLNRKVTLTILVAKENKVTANFAIVQPNATDAPKVLNAIAKMLGKPELTKKDLEELGVGPDSAMKPDAALMQLMRQMIQKDNDEEAVKKVADEMVKWAGDDAKKKTQLKEYCQKVVKLNYGNEHAQKALKRLAGE